MANVATGNSLMAILAMCPQPPLPSSVALLANMANMANAVVANARDSHGMSDWPGTPPHPLATAWATPVAERSLAAYEEAVP